MWNAGSKVQNKVCLFHKLQKLVGKKYEWKTDSLELQSAAMI